MCEPNKDVTHDAPTAGPLAHMDLHNDWWRSLMNSTSWELQKQTPSRFTWRSLTKLVFWKWNMAVEERKKRGSTKAVSLCNLTYCSSNGPVSCALLFAAERHRTLQINSRDTNMFLFKKKKRNFCGCQIFQSRVFILCRHNNHLLWWPT